MAALFCCDSITPYKSRQIDHEAKFTAFMTWAQAQSTTDENNEKPNLDQLAPPYAVQLVRQVNFGPLESKRYFVPVTGQDGPFVEITESEMINANFKKFNS